MNGEAQDNEKIPLALSLSKEGQTKDIAAAEVALTISRPSISLAIAELESL
ncbi:MAG: hypothetical protein JKX90_00710 [Colwellia sp.]|jgi:hypothetical protein|nr:hypothetical protein [Colwellia sp.]